VLKFGDIQFFTPATIPYSAAAAVLSNSVEFDGSEEKLHLRNLSRVDINKLAQSNFRG
jgi:hypothetical protein